MKLIVNKFGTFRIKLYICSMKKSGIYQIVNKVNGKSYIGSSINLTWRKTKHFTELRNQKHHSIILQKAFNKYNEDNFEFKILANTLPEHLIKLEQWYIDNLKPEYNVCRIAGSCLGVKRSKESIEKRLKTEQTHLLPRDLEVIEALKTGKEQKQIAVDFNLSPSYITQIKNKYNIVTEIKRTGNNNGFSKLTEEQVKEIKYLLKDKVKQQTIADKYNVKLRTIKAIQSGQNWNHITIE